MNQYTYEYKKPVVQTKFGKLRGATYGDVNIFMGVKYADAKRFQMPVEQQPWEGIKNAYVYGPVTPQMMPPNPPSYYRGLHMLRKETEECQNLNIWAPKTLNGEKKPVFVWMHGGGYFAGNALEEYSFDGFNMCHYGDIVFVSINHRLNVLAHMNLKDYGPEFEHSVNVGIADLVAALKWIHENIAAFGGDPENVTICGHSGGGGKVQCMFQIEEAASYFQKGIVLSGSSGKTRPGVEEDSRKVAKAVMDELGITKENIEKVYEVSYQEICDAVRAVTPKLMEQGIRPNWSPVADSYFKGFPNDVGFMPWSANKPMLFGSVLGEFPAVRFDSDEKDAMTDADKMACIKERFGEHTDKVLELFKKAYPTHELIDVVQMDAMVRIHTVMTALEHAKNGKANTYNYIASYCAPEDGWVPLWHGGDVGYIFMNEDKVFVLNEPVVGQKLAAAFSGMALNFTKYGDPNNNALPKWEPMTTEHHFSMVIDRECELKEGFDEELVKTINEVCPFRGFGM